MSGALQRLGHQLTSAAEEVPAERLAVAKHRVDELIAVFDEATRPSRNPDVVAALAQLRHASETLGRALGRAHRIVGALSSLADQWGLTPIRRTLPPVPASASALRPRSSATAPGDQATPAPIGPKWVEVGPAQVPKHIRDAGDRFRPRPAGTSRPTIGRLGEELVESGGTDRTIAADLDHGPLRAAPVTFYQHVEAKVAARMRRDKSMAAELAIDNTVCGSNPRDQDMVWSCDRILPSILPVGAMLTVWITRDSGHTWWRRTYRGNGERIKP
jgi:Double-stranded DNA deaminase toxin A